MQAVLERLHARMAQERELSRRLSAEAFEARLDEFMLAIGEDSGRLLNVLAKAAGCRSMLEAGTSVGYSTLWLADAARETGGRVLSVDLSPAKSAEARATLRDAGLLDFVELVTGDVLDVIARRPGPYDLVLLDAWKETYVPAFDALREHALPGALVAADNIVNPGSQATRDYQAHVRATPGWESLLLRTGNGVELSRRLSQGALAGAEVPLREVLSRLHTRMAAEDRLRATLSPQAFAARRPELMLAIGEDSARLLHLLVRLSGARRVLEIGTSVGYSTLWLADALRQTGGRVTSLDASADKHRQAAENLAQAGLAGPVELVTAQAPAVLQRLPGPFDLVLLDCERSDYLPCFEAFRGKLAPGALVVADNMTFPPSPHAPAYQVCVRGLAGWDSVLVPIGNGIELSRRPR
jgi:predicted O-methyltransferase YrrM